MKKELNSKNFIFKFLAVTFIILMLCAGTVILFDPFFHYHKPLPFLKAVLWEKEYQVPGTLDHFDYDAMIVGSSVSENNNNHWFDEAFGCTSIKAIRSYGATSDLCYFIERGFKHQNLKYVFLNLDPSSLTTGTETTFEETGSPMYLYNNNPFDDVRYLFNKDVLCERIPYMLAASLMKDYDEGTSYNWAQWKSFDEDTALYHYIRDPHVTSMLPEDSFKETALINIAKIESIVSSHPETEFYIYIPPYSILWWDTALRNGETESYLYVERLAFTALLKYDNVRLFNFQNAEDIAFDLNNYTDNIHFGPDINKYMCDCLKNGTYEIKNESDLEASLNMVHSYVINASEYVDTTFGDRVKVNPE